MPEAYFVLAIAHHLAVFGLFGLLVSEIALLRRAMPAPEIARLARVDGLYGLLSVLVIAIGVARAVWGGKGAAYYIENPFFWAKMAAFAAVGLLSIKPTMVFISWRRRIQTEPTWSPGPGELAAIRPWIMAEVGGFALIPIFAAAMAQGVGL